MKVEKINVKNEFDPVELKITFESEKELTLFKEMTGFCSTVAKTVREIKPNDISIEDQITLAKLLAQIWEKI